MYDDQAGGGDGELYALESDGSERWRNTSIGSVETTAYTDGVVYAISSSGVEEQVVRAFDATDGEVLWPTEEPADHAVSRSLITVTEVVYVIQDEDS